MCIRDRGNDVTAPVAIGEMKKMNVDCVFCKDKIALVPDHFTPNKDIKSAELYKCVKDFAAVSYTHLDVYKRQFKDNQS